MYLPTLCDDLLRIINIHSFLMLLQQHIIHNLRTHKSGILNIIVGSIASRMCSASSNWFMSRLAEPGVLFHLISGDFLREDSHIKIINAMLFLKKY